MRVFQKRARLHRDLGMTLPELLVSVTLTGIIATSLAMTVNVMISNRNNTLGRANNSRSEQNVGLFMPTDLASSESEDTDPWAVPCGPTAGADHLLGTGDDVPAPPCPPEALLSGSNALLLTWKSSVVIAGNPVTTETKVSYRVILEGTEYQLIRVKCESVPIGAAPTCSTQIVLHDLTPPPPWVTFEPGITKPDWIITVSKATDPLDASGPSDTAPPVDPGLKNKNGQRVVVTVNGGGGGDSASGGQSQIFLSAGGTNRESGLSTEDLTGAPTFTAARSRCGGNIGMVVDTSGSIQASQMQAIKQGIQAFLDEFAGTPVKLQVVTFSDTGLILGSPSGAPKWYDMLVDSDVQALKTLIGDPNNAASGIAPGGHTNWEDGFLRMLRNVDGTIPAQLPSKVIFFTDGVPTDHRLNHTTSTAPVVADPLDAGLPTAQTSSLSQVGWNRAERVVRDRGKVDVIGIFVSTLPTDTVAHTPSSAYEDWTTASAGYHLQYERGDTVLYQRGYHVGWQVGNNVVWEKGSHLGYQRNNNIVFERSTTGLTYEKLVSGNWSATTTTLYFGSGGNTTPDSTDGWRVRITGALGPTYTTTNMTQATYDTTNTTVDASDGFRTRIPNNLSNNWTTVTAAQYNASNTTSDSSDGWQTYNVYSSPYDNWELTNQNTYDSNNTDSTTTDGWRTRQTAPSTAWATATQTQYTKSNTTADATDGWQTYNIYTSSYTLWENTTQALYDANNTNTGTSDGWRTTTTGTPASWTPVTLAQYNASNTTTDSTDGWRISKIYSAPITNYDLTTKRISDIDLLGNVIIGDLSGNTGSYNRVDAPGGGAPYPDNAAAAADVFALPDYTYFAQALDKIVLGECGGTVTIQTKNSADLLGAKDPFSYVNSSNNTVVKTSSAFKSGTFDVAFPGEAAKTITISPQEFTNLSAWSHDSWACKSKGVAYPFTTAPVDGHPLWKSITLTVHANEAISCTQMVTYHG